MFARAEQGGRHGQARLPFKRLNRHTGGDATVERDFDNVIGGLRRGANIGGKCRRRRLHRARPTAFGHAQHFQRARPIGQAADELAFLQRADQPVNARLGFQVERLLHFLK